MVQVNATTSLKARTKLLKTIGRIRSFSIVSYSGTYTVTVNAVSVKCRFMRFLKHSSRYLVWSTFCIFSWRASSHFLMDIAWLRSVGKSSGTLFYYYHETSRQDIPCIHSTNNSLFFSLETTLIKTKLRPFDLVHEVVDCWEGHVGTYRTDSLSLWASTPHNGSQDLVLGPLLARKHLHNTVFEI